LEVKDRYRQRLNHTSNLADAAQPRPKTWGIWRLKTGRQERLYHNSQHGDGHETEVSNFSDVKKENFWFGFFVEKYNTVTLLILI